MGHRSWDSDGAHAPLLDAKYYYEHNPPQLRHRKKFSRPGMQFSVSVRVQLANDERDGVRERSDCGRYT